ncbi:MAG: hypothetical protein QW272_08315 [Candidatus Methanomethylicaceae archaeon]
MSDIFTFKGLDELKSFILEIKSQGIDVENVLKSLRYIYAANSIPYKRDVIEQRFISPIKEEMLDILENYGLIEEGKAKGSGEDRTYFKSITEYGKKLGSQAFLKYIEENINEIEANLDTFSRKLIYVTILSSIEKDYSLRYELTIFSMRIHELIPNVAFIEQSEETMEELEKLIKPFDYFGIKKVSLPKENIIFAKTMSRYKECAAHIEKFFSMLCKLGLAIMQTYYTSSGHPIGNEYKAPPETTALLMRKTIDVKFNEEEIENFGLLSVLIKSIKSRMFSKGEAKETLSEFGISEEELIKLLDKLAKKGITGKYNILGADTSPPFLILNREEFENFIIQGLNEITLKIIKKENME